MLKESPVRNIIILFRCTLATFRISLCAPRCTATSIKRAKWKRRRRARVRTPTWRTEATNRILQMSFPYWIHPTSHINRRGQINRVEITKSRGNTRRWRVCEERRFAIEPSVAFINGPIFEDGIFVVVVSLLLLVPRGLKVYPPRRQRRFVFGESNDE